MGRTVEELFGLNNPDLSWQKDAACRGVNPELFFPTRGDDTRVASRICSSCPVREECLEYAISHVEKFGIWGGLSERERRRLRRQRKLVQLDKHRYRAVKTS